MTKKIKEKEWNYEVVVAGQQVNIIGHTMTEPQARGILEHFVKGAGLKDIIFSVKRLTPEPVNWSMATGGYGDIQLNDTNSISFTQSDRGVDWANIPDLEKKP